MGTYIIAPIWDAVACDDCHKDVSLQVEQKDPSNGPCLSYSTARTDDHEKDLPSNPGMHKEHCPLCSNATPEMMSYKCFAPFLTVHAAVMPTLLALLDPSYPINKPPQN
jgi:hypothetical protein